MMKVRRRRRALLAAGAAAIGLPPLAWSLLRRAPPPPAPLARITIAASAVPHTSLLHLADALGYFTAEGLAVTLRRTSTGPEGMELLAAGQADLATASDVVVTLSVLKGQAVGIVVSIMHAEEAGIVARRDHGIAVPQDPLEKSVGVTSGTLGEYFLWVYLLRHGLRAESIRLLNLPPDRMAAALADGTVDAVATWQPHVHAARLALVAGNAVLFEGDAAYTETHLLAGRMDYLKRNPEVLARLLRALLRAEQFIRSSPEQAMQAISARLALDQELLRAVWSQFDFRVELRQSQLGLLEDQARWAMARGYVPRGPMPDFLEHLHPAALLATQPSRVTIAR